MSKATPKVSLAKALYHCLCPRCRQGKLYTHRWWKLNNIIDTHSHCPVCGEQFQKQPGFFWLATYVSYAFNVGIIMVTFGGLLLLPYELGVWTMIGIVTAVTLLFAPLILRASRILALYIFGQIDYEPDWDEG